MARLACAALLPAVLIAGCGGGTTTVTETQGGSTGDVTTAAAPTTPAVTARTGSQGPHYFETPSHNIGCYVSAHDARCDIRERDWSPPPEPRSCKKIGLDYGQGIVVGPHPA